MADDDEIDILGDFSFNSCLAQNNQGIPSCSSREDTVHPQWFLDSTANNWYDTQSKINRDTLTNRNRKISESSVENSTEVITTWNQLERKLLVKEMAKYGRNIRKISESIKSKSEAEIQALIDAEYGVHLDSPIIGLEKDEDQDDVPGVVQEEIVAAETLSTPKLVNVKYKKVYHKKHKTKQSLLKPNALKNKMEIAPNNPSDIFYEDDLDLGSTESIGSDLSSTDMVSKNLTKCQKAKVVKKIGNHRRKVLRNYDKSKPTSKDLMKSLPGRQAKDASLSENSTKSPKMQIVLGSGQSLPVSKGEQVIKIEKKKDSEPESDIDIDVDSDQEKCSSSRTKAELPPKLVIDEAPIAVPLRKFEPMPRRQKKINLDGGGGYTIMHTESGDLYEITSEPRKERQPRKQPIQLVPCRIYNSEQPAPFTVQLFISALISMDWHAHQSRGEVMGLLGAEELLGGEDSGGPLTLQLVAYRPVDAASAHTHCDMDPVSQAAAGEWVRRRGLGVGGWHHSHPRFAASPSWRDLRSQRVLQRGLRPLRCVALITSQHWPVGRRASQYRCIYVENDDDDDSVEPVGYQLNIKLVPDVTEHSVDELVEQLTAPPYLISNDPHGVDLQRDICPEANMTYFDKIHHSCRQVALSVRQLGYLNPEDLIADLDEKICRMNISESGHS